ncbi:MAG: oligosaccharide flippase family protein [Myxococcales bacterium]|nr:oligosaccharide flippase family protein [Myxococcales bacterium]
MGQGIGQLLRLSSSVILTRFLVPEVYGLMELVYVFLTALYLFSDVGLATCIVQSSRGDDPDFLNTAWTIQVIRGGILFFVAIALGYPAAAFYEQPLLAALIPSIGVVALIEGFDATALHTETRRINLARVVQLELVMQLATMVVQVAVAVIWPSVWVLVIGSWVGAIVRLIGSHRFLPAIRHRFVLEKRALQEIYSFGKWIFGSTALHFVTNQGDRLVLARLLEGLAGLGVYAIAGRLKMAAQALMQRLILATLFPALAERYRELEGDHARTRLLSEAYYRSRLRLDAIFITGSGMLLALGPTVIDVLYSQEYAQAGQILQVFSVEIAMSVALWPAETLLIVIGKTKYGFFRSLSRAIWVCVAFPLGWYLNGFFGLVWAVALSEIPTVVVLWLGLMRNGLFKVQRELIGPAFFVAGWCIGLSVEMLMRSATQ